jgi:O-antigen/teichoic acid export membrane protein
MQKKFLTNLGLLLALNLLIKPAWIFGIDLTVQNITGLADYGFYFNLINLSFLFNILLDLGITNFNNRNIAQNNQLLNKHFSAIVVIKFVLAGIYAVIVFTAAFVLRFGKEQFVLLGWLVFNQILVSFILYMRSNISGLLMFRTDSILSVMDRTLMILFCGIMIWGKIFGDTFRIEWFVYAQTAAYGVTLLAATLIVIKKAKFRKLSMKWPFFLLIMKQSMPFALLVLLMTFYNRLDPVMIGRLLPKETGFVQNGIYASAFRLLDASNNIAYLFSVLLIPVFSRMLKMNEAVDRMLKLSFTIIITIAVIVAIGSISYSYEMMEFLYPSHGLESAAVFRLLMGGFIAVSTTYIFGTLLTANGSLKALNIISFAGLIINFTLNLLLIPRLMAQGSAYASLVTQFFIALIQVIIVQRIFRFRINYRYLLTLLVFVTGVIAISFLSKKFPPEVMGIRPGPNTWMINLLIMVLFSFVLAGILRLWSIRSLFAILRDNR